MKTINQKQEKEDIDEAIVFLRWGMQKYNNIVYSCYPY